MPHLRSRFFLFIFPFFLFCNALYAADENNVPVVYLTPPSTDPEDIIGHNVGVRPGYEHGVKQGKTEVDNKTIYHNEGHGGFGLGISYGSSEAVVNNFLRDNQDKNDKSNPQQVAVLGAGIIGLTTALLLKEHGIHPVVYASEFPTENCIMDDEKPCITSNVAGGLWRPFGIKGLPKETYFAWQIASFEHMSKKIEAGYPGLSFRDFYSFNPSYTHPSDLAPGVLNEAKPVKVSFDGGQSFHKALQFKTILMDSAIYPSALYQEALKKGIRFERRNFSSLEEILELPTPTIFSCLGLTAGKIYKDPAFYPVRGQILYLSPQHSSDYFLSGPTPFGNLSLYPSHRGMGVGSIVQKGKDSLEFNQEDADYLHNKLKAFFAEKISNQ